MRTYLCRLDDIGDGAARGFAPPGANRDTLFLVRRGNHVKGWLDACPHINGAPLAWRKDAYLSADRQAIVCYGHGALFDIETGFCTKGPCMGQSLTPQQVELDAQGNLWTHWADE